MDECSKSKKAKALGYTLTVAASAAAAPVGIVVRKYFESHYSAIPLGVAIFYGSLGLGAGSALIALTTFFKGASDIPPVQPVSIHQIFEAQNRSPLECKVTKGAEGVISTKLPQSVFR